MNSLEKYIWENNFNEAVSMNTLQNCGIVSDNAIRAADVAETDCLSAINFLEKGRELLRQKNGGARK
jgi:hypothetical protein